MTLRSRNRNLSNCKFNPKLSSSLFLRSFFCSRACFENLSNFADWLAVVWNKIWRAPVLRQKPPCFKCAHPIMICWRGLVKREVTRNAITRNNLISPLSVIFISFFRHVTVNVDRGIGWDSAVKQLQDNGKNKFDGFFCSKREQKGRRLYLLAIQKESSTHLFNITR